MTEQEAIEWIKAISAVQKESIHKNSLLQRKEALHMAIEALKKQAEYKDLEEQGLLFRLPIAVGSTFWELNNAVSEPYIYPRIAHSLMHVVYCLERLGKITFLTEEAAEAALEKMRGEE